VKHFLTIIILNGILSHSLTAQCSDAGVCVIGSAHPTAGHTVGASYSYGKGDKRDGTSFHSFTLDAELRLFDGTDLVVKMPYTRVTGPLGSVSGAGDLTVLVNHLLLNTGGGRLTIQAGGKFPTGVSNAEGLPQSYQPGLGTTDLLLGTSFVSGPVIVAAGYQLSRGRSDNAVTRLKRGDDLFGRCGVRGPVGKFTLGAELLAIGRLDKSSILSFPAPSSGSGGAGETFVSVPGSDQFQMNLLTTASLPLDGGVSLTAEGAFALLKREVNVDGLTRGLTLSAGISYSP